MLDLTPKWDRKTKTLFITTTVLISLLLVGVFSSILADPVCHIVSKNLLIWLLVAAIEINYFLCAQVIPKWNFSGIEDNLRYPWTQLRIRASFSAVPVAFAIWLIFEGFLPLNTNPRVTPVLQKDSAIPSSWSWDSMLDANRCLLSNTSSFTTGLIIQAAVVIPVAIYYGLLFIFVNLTWFVDQQDNEQKELVKKVRQIVSKSMIALEGTSRKRVLVPSTSWYRGLVNLATKELIVPKVENSSINSEMIELAPRKPVRQDTTTEDERLRIRNAAYTHARKEIVKMLSAADFYWWTSQNHREADLHLRTIFLVGAVHFLVKHPDTLKIGKSLEAKEKTPEKSADDIPLKCEYCSDVCGDTKLACGHSYHWKCIESIVLNRDMRCCGQNHSTKNYHIIHQLKSMNS